GSDIPRPHIDAQGVTVPVPAPPGWAGAPLHPGAHPRRTATSPTNGIDEHGRYGHDQPIQRARRGCVRPTRHQPGNALDLPQWTATRSSRPPPPGECPRVGGPAQRGCRTGRTTDREGGEVSTRGAIAIPNTNGKGWWGRYHHGDSFPTRLGAELFRLYQGSFGRDHEDM